MGADHDTLDVCSECGLGRFDCMQRPDLHALIATANATIAELRAQVEAHPYTQADHDAWHLSMSNTVVKHGRQMAEIWAQTRAAQLVVEAAIDWWNEPRSETAGGRLGGAVDAYRQHQEGDHAT